MNLNKLRLEVTQLLESKVRKKLTRYNRQAGSEAGWEELKI